MDKNFTDLQNKGLDEMSKIDLFSGSNGNNGFIVAGVGRHPIISLLAGNHIATGGRVIIFDTGSNFSHLTKSVNGQYIEIDTKKPISIDLASELSDGSFNIKESFILDALVDFIYSIGSVRMKYSNEEERIIKLKIDEVLNEFIPIYGKHFIRPLVEFMSGEDNPPSLITFAKNLKISMDRFNFKKFVSNDDGIDISAVDFNKLFTVVDFSRIVNSDLRNAVAGALIVSILKDLYFNKREKTVVFIDNINYFLTDDAAVPDIKPLIECLLRRSRTLNTSIVIGAESFDIILDRSDLNKSDLSRLILNNTQYKFSSKEQNY